MLPVKFLSVLRMQATVRRMLWRAPTAQCPGGLGEKKEYVRFILFLNILIDWISETYPENEGGKKSVVIGLFIVNFCTGAERVLITSKW